MKVRGNWGDRHCESLVHECRGTSRGTSPYRTTVGAGVQDYRGISRIRKRTPVGPYRRLMLRVLGGS